MPQELSGGIFLSASVRPEPRALGQLPPPPEMFCGRDGLL